MQYCHSCNQSFYQASLTSISTLCLESIISAVSCFHSLHVAYPPPGKRSASALLFSLRNMVSHYCAGEFYLLPPVTSTRMSASINSRYKSLNFSKYSYLHKRFIEQFSGKSVLKRHIDRGSKIYSITKSKAILRYYTDVKSVTVSGSFAKYFFHNSFLHLHEKPMVTDVQSYKKTRNLIVSLQTNINPCSFKKLPTFLDLSREFSLQPTNF